MNQTLTPTTYSLSIEELALAVGLINRPELGRDLLASIYPNLSEIESEARLSAASHSLLARGLCTLNGSASPVLLSEFEHALLPLVKFDYLFQISIVIGDGQANLTVHVRKKHTFTARLIQGGVVNVLTHGPSSGLLDYFLDIFEGIGRGAGGRTHPSPIRMQTMGQIASKQIRREEKVALLMDLGWKKEDAQLLSEDLEHQEMRATIIRIKAGDQAQTAEVKDQDHKNLLLLNSAARSWGFLFDHTRDEAAGQAFLLDQKIFRELLSAMTA